jgi:hypothetical protein
MPRHQLEMTIPPKAILNTDVVITVVEDGVKLGELRISRGSVDWRPARAHGIHRMSWARFDELMRERGRRLAP